MKNKNERLAAIRRLITNNCYATQGDLVKALQAEGFSCTQTTVSRDLKALRAVKTEVGQGRNAIILPDEPRYKRVEKSVVELAERSSNAAMDKMAAQVAVLHTQPGYAVIVARAIDERKVEGVLGTIAGVDTVFVALAEGCDANVIATTLRTIVLSVKAER